MTTDINTDRFKQPVAPNGRDLNSILAKYDIDVIERALREHVGNLLDRGCMARLHRADEKQIAIIDTDYEKAVVTYHKFTGRSPLGK